MKKLFYILMSSYYETLLINFQVELRHLSVGIPVPHKSASLV